MILPCQNGGLACVALDWDERGPMKNGEDSELNHGTTVHNTTY